MEKELGITLVGFLSMGHDSIRSTPPPLPLPTSGLLDDVELRWALSSTSKQLEENVDRFLCPVLLKVGSPHEAVRAKVMQMLSNINVRIKSDQELRLPVSLLFDQLLNPQVPAIVKNFTMIYLDMGFTRLPLEVCPFTPPPLAILPQLRCVLFYSSRTN